MHRHQHTKIFLVCLIASVSSVWCAWNSANPPYLVQVKIKDADLLICAGTLIGPNNVVTAADFLDGYLAENVTVVGAVKYPSAEGLQRNVSKILTLENGDHEPMWDKDIAILELASPMEDEHVSIISLTTEAPKSGDLVELLGWTYADEIIKPKNVVKLPIISNEECDTKLAELSTNVSYSMMCAYKPSDEKEGDCFSLLGSPVIFQGKLSGIVLQDVSCGHEDPAVLTDITKVRDFIEKSMKF